MLILIGSTRPAKVDGTRAAIAAIGAVDTRFAGATFESRDLTAIAPRMPMSAADIIDGARRRAQALLGPNRAQNRPAADFAVGLEGGLEPVAHLDAWTLQTWAAVTDGTIWGYGAGPSIALPPAVVARVRNGEELGDVIDEIAGVGVRGTRGAWGVLTCDLIGRRDAFRAAVIAAFARFYGKGWEVE